MNDSSDEQIIEANESVKENEVRVGEPREKELEVWLQKTCCLSSLGSLKGASHVDADSTFSC